MRKFLPIALLLIASLTACQTTGSNNTVQLSFKQGDILEGNFQFGFGNLIAPLPVGQWEVAATYSKRNNLNNVNIYMILIQEQNGIVANVVEIGTNQHPTSWGFRRSKMCSRKDMHFRETFENYGGRVQDCMWLNHYNGISPPRGWYGELWQSAIKYATTKDYKWPLAIMGSGHRFARNNQFLSYEFGFNPGAYGFPEPKRLDWATSDWHPNITAGQEDKTAYIAKLKNWTISFHKTVKAGWNGDLVEGYVESIPEIGLKLGSADELSTVTENSVE